MFLAWMPAQGRHDGGAERLRRPACAEVVEVAAHHDHPPFGGGRFAAVVGRDGLSVEIREVAEWDDPWDVKVSTIMVPSVENITSTEERLDSLARAHGGRADGWGFMRV